MWWCPGFIWGMKYFNYKEPNLGKKKRVHSQERKGGYMEKGKGEANPPTRH